MVVYAKLRDEPPHKVSEGWPAHLAITDDLLADVDPRIMTAGDGMVRFMGKTGALYAYSHDDPEVPGVKHYDLVREEAKT